MQEVFDRIASFYDLEVADMWGEEDIHFYIEYAKNMKGHALELACGTGRITIPMADEGIKVVGLDISKEMLEVANKKINMLDKKSQKNIKLIKGNMRNFDLGQKFSYIFIAFRAFQSLLTREDQKSCLTCAKKHLDTNGILIIDLFAPSHIILASKERSKYLGNIYDKRQEAFITIKSETEFNLANQTLKEDRFYEWTDKNGNFHRKMWSFELSYLFRYEAEFLLENQGFKVENVFGDFNKSPYNYYSGEQIFVARKK